MRTLITLIVLSLSTSMAVSQESSKQHSFGIGLGIPYGILGANVDYRIASNLCVSAGIGTTVIAGIGYSAGLKFYFVSPENKLRPRISAFYGVNSAVEKKGGSDPGKESFSGLSIGAGIQWMWGVSRSNGLDFDLFYLATSGLDIDKIRDQGYSVSDPGNVTFSVGYRRAF